MTAIQEIRAVLSETNNNIYSPLHDKNHVDHWQTVKTVRKLESMIEIYCELISYSIRRRLRHCIEINRQGNHARHST